MADRFTEDESFYDDDTESDFLLQGISSQDGRAARAPSYPVQPSVPFVHAADAPASADCPWFDSIVRVANAATGPGLVAVPFIFQQAVSQS
jgi:hypothetical protein